MYTLIKNPGKFEFGTILRVQPYFRATLKIVPTCFPLSSFNKLTNTSWIKLSQCTQLTSVQSTGTTQSYLCGFFWTLFFAHLCTKKKHMSYLFYCCWYIYWWMHFIWVVGMLLLMMLLTSKHTTIKVIFSLLIKICLLYNKTTNN